MANKSNKGNNANDSDKDPPEVPSDGQDGAGTENNTPEPETTQTEPESGTDTAKQGTESEYAIYELMGVAKRQFNTSSDLVCAALKCNGKEAYTLKDAQQIVEEFMKQEVI